jgi:hypothetical protein
MNGATIKKLIHLLPNGVFCRELKLLYESGRLVDGFSFKNIDEMGLTTIEKIFVKWAMKQWKKQVLREEVKAWATKLAITGKDEENEIRRARIYQGVSPTPLRINSGKVDQSIQDARREEDRRAILQAVRAHREPSKVGEDVGNT